MKKIFTIGSFSLLAMAGLIGGFTSCRSDFDYEEAKRQNKEFAYRETFEKEFGKIDPNQNWDFTASSSTRAGYGENYTWPAEPNGLNNWTTTYTAVDNNLVKSLGNVMIEGAQNRNPSWSSSNDDNYDNRSKGVPFVCTVPNNPFRITPVFQGGNSTSNVKVYMQVEYKGTTRDYIIWNKGDGLQVYTSNAWRNVNRSDDANNRGTTTGSYESRTYEGETHSFAKTYDNVQAKSLIINEHINDEVNPSLDLPVGATLKFHSYAYYNRAPYNHYSWGDEDDIEILKLEQDKFTRPTTGVGSDTNHEILVIACEAGADHDCNDVVFLIEGYPKAPKPEEITPGTDVETYPISKRYMVEDIGAIDASDIDFNDIVVDVKQVTRKVYTINKVNGVFDPDTRAFDHAVVTQTATVRALGGTKDITLYINDQPFFRKGETDAAEIAKLNSSYGGSTITSGLDVKTMYNTGTPLRTGASSDNYDNPNDHLFEIVLNTQTFTVDQETYTISPWVPAENNVKVKVFGDDSTYQDITTDANKDQWISFPANGDVPYMIAVDPDKQRWNLEQRKVFDGGNLDNPASSGYYLLLKNSANQK